jgi:hypothetical protein
VPQSFDRKYCGRRLRGRIRSLDGTQNRLAMWHRIAACRHPGLYLLQLYFCLYLPRINVNNRVNNFKLIARRHIDQLVAKEINFAREIQGQ